MSTLKSDLAFGDSRSLKPGDRVLLLGYPLISEGMTEASPSIFETIVSNTTSTYLKLMGAAGIGSSGDSVYSIDQEAVVATVAKELTYITVELENYSTADASFAVPVHRFEDLLKETAREYRQVSSREKAELFKRKVAELYTAQGFTTKLDIPVGGGAAIDIYATIKHAGSQFCLALDCLYKIGVVEADDVRKFYTSVAMAKSPSTPVHKCALVSNASFSTDARDIAARSDIDLIDFQALSSSMVDFQGYLRQIIED
jgi:hypothetical protein